MLMPTLVSQYWWPSQCYLDTVVGAGYHAFNWLESTNASGLTVIGSVGNSQSHMRLRAAM